MQWLWSWLLVGLPTLYCILLLLPGEREAAVNFCSMVENWNGCLRDFFCLCRSVGVNLTLDDFQKVSDQVPFLADLKPSGKYVMEDVHKVHRNHPCLNRTSCPLLPNDNFFTWTIRWVSCFEISWLIYVDWWHTCSDSLSSWAWILRWGLHHWYFFWLPRTCICF